MGDHLTKAIAIFSGKGGVGKTTIASLLAVALAKKHKVALLDMDINTPSIPVMFGGQQKIGNLHLFSIGFDTTAPITYTGKMVRKVLRSLAERVTKLNPDVCIMDLPPGTSDIHLEVCATLQPSSFILVTQPNKLSEEDALRATKVFMTTKVPIAGIIKNMSGEVFGDPDNIDILGLPVLAVISLDKSLAKAGSDGCIHKIKDNPLLDVCEYLLKEASDVSWVTLKKTMFEGPDFNTLCDSGVVRLGDEYNLKRTFRFYGTNSWDDMRDILSRLAGHDRFLLYNDTDTIRRMINGLDDDQTGLFMVIRPPRTSTVLFPGEIGVARLVEQASMNQMYYGVPRLIYPTDEGEVVLFPHEVSPITADKLTELLKYGELVMATASKTPRYLPTPELAQAAAYNFGLHLAPDWKEVYEKLGIEVK